MMIAILLALLGVPLWLVAGMVLGALYSRRRFKQAPEAFRCKVRLVSGTGSSLKTTCGRMPGYARWVHDVLLVNQGLALIRILPIGVVEVVTGPDKGDPAEAKRLGPAPPGALAARRRGLDRRACRRRSGRAQDAWAVRRHRRAPARQPMSW
jgi:hypothetical protein